VESEVASAQLRDFSEAKGCQLSAAEVHCSRSVARCLLGIVVLLNGVVVWLSSASWDHNDQTTWNKEHLRERFQQKPWVPWVMIYTFNPVSFLAKKGLRFWIQPQQT